MNLVRNHRDYIPSDEFIWRSFLYIANSHIVLLTQQQSEPITVRTLKKFFFDILSLDQRNLPYIETGIQSKYGMG